MGRKQCLKFMITTAVLGVVASAKYVVGGAAVVGSDAMLGGIQGLCLAAVAGLAFAGVEAAQGGIRTRNSVDEGKIYNETLYFPAQVADRARAREAPKRAKKRAAEQATVASVGELRPNERRTEDGSYYGMSGRYRCVYTFFANQINRLLVVFNSTNDRLCYYAGPIAAGYAGFQKELNPIWNTSLLHEMRRMTFTCIGKLDSQLSIFAQSLSENVEPVFEDLVGNVLDECCEDQDLLNGKQSICCCRRNSNKGC